ncbi:hypothetical protein KCP75_21890 [Salmonella enterica subsp. enterica]|nr:hypothetical protein KCP75_21890 [Salmonella enterica subsp. enterica]
MGEINNRLKQLDNTGVADYERHRNASPAPVDCPSSHTDEIRKQSKPGGCQMGAAVG